MEQTIHHVAMFLVVPFHEIAAKSTLIGSRYVRIVPNDDQAVAAATQELIHQKINPALIRQKTIERMIEQRQNFIALLQTIFNANQQGLDAARFWYTHFRAKLGRWRSDASKEVLTRELEGG